jgi:hypothetical protein
MVSGMAYGADVDGTWTTESASGPHGVFPVAFNFRADGATLTGSSALGFDRSDVPPEIQRSEGPIQGGKIDGNTITFTVTYNFSGTPSTVWYTGVVASNQIRIAGASCAMPKNWKLGQKGWDCPPPGFGFQFTVTKGK